MSPTSATWTANRAGKSKPVLCPPASPTAQASSCTRPVVGCRYLAPVKGYPAFFQLPASYLDAWVRLSGPDFSTLPAVTLTARDRAMSWLVDDTLISHGPDTMKALLTRSTGVFSGTYTDTPFGVSQAIGGVLLQKARRRYWPLPARACQRAGRHDAKAVTEPHPLL